MIRKIAVYISTLGINPNVPMPGTIASLVTATIVLWQAYASKLEIVSPLVPWIFFILALPIINEALKSFYDKDPSNICLDEVVGMLFALVAVELNWATVLASFLLFRFFDIKKPLGIKRAELLPGAIGVVVDDVLAGVLANITLKTLLLCWNHFN